MASLTQIEILLPELRAFSRSICYWVDDAEDLVQDAIERALRRFRCIYSCPRLR